MRPTLLISRLIVAGATIAAGTLLVPGGVLTASAGKERIPSAVLPTCMTSGLAIWLDTEGNGSAGGSYYNLEFTNLSGHACTMSGYPGVSAVNLDGHQLGSAASRNSTHAAKVVTLSGVTTKAGFPSLGTNVTATVVLKITDVGVYSPSTCRYVTAAGLRVYPPGQTSSKVVPFPFAGCSRTGAIYLNVEAIQKAVLSQ